jgi:hypothetical protein
MSKYLSQWITFPSENIFAKNSKISHYGQDGVRWAARSSLAPQKTGNLYGISTK